MNVFLNKIKNNSLNNIWYIFVIFVAIVTGISISIESWTYIAILVGPILIYLSLVKPFIFPFGLYVMLLPFDSVLSFTSGGATWTKFLGILTIMVLLIKGIHTKNLKWPDNVSLTWIFFIIYCALTVLWAIQPEDVISRLPTAVGLLILYLVSATYKSQKKDFDTLKYFIAAGGFFAAVFTIYNYSSITGMRTTLQIGEQSASLNKFAFSLIIPISVCLQIMLDSNKKLQKSLMIIITGVILFCIIITGSRGGSLGVGIVIAIYILSSRKKLTFSVILIAVICAILPVIPDFFIERWKSAVESGGTGRSAIWYVGWKSISEYWALGAGLSNFPNAYSEFAFHDISKGWDRGAHNIFIEFIVELGIVGFSLMLFAFTKHYRAIGNHLIPHSNDSTMLKASFWSILVSSFFSGTFWLKSFWLLWMLVIIYKNTVENKRYINERHLLP